MFDVEIKNLKVFANIGITSDETKKKQLLKVTLNYLPSSIFLVAK